MNDQNPITPKAIKAVAQLAMLPGEGGDTQGWDLPLAFAQALGAEEGIFVVHPMDAPCPLACLRADVLGQSLALGQVLRNAITLEGRFLTVPPMMDGEEGT